MSRKKFLKIFSYLLILPFIYLWDSISKKKNKNEKQNNPVILKNDFPEGISFSGTFIINKSGNELKIFSSKCSHLGCKINKLENNEIVCPCHGSRYSLNGEVLKGPSTNPLSELEHKSDLKNGNIIIYPV